jgi:type II secretory pathway component GspD/PulD (secretin)
MKRMLFILVIAIATFLAGHLFALDVTNAPAERSDLISEIIPIKYAKASDLGALIVATNNMRSAIFAGFTKHHSELVGDNAIELKLVKMGSRQVAADERNNSLYIRATRRDMIALKEIIATLDVVLAQILVEAVIIEFPITHSSGVPRVATEPRPGLTALNDLGFIVNTTFPFQQTNTGKLNQLSYLATLQGDLDSMINALATNAGVRILQRPRIQTSEGEPAMLFIGCAPPYPGGPFGGYTCGCPSNPTVIVGRTFEVSCLLPAKDLIQLDINISTETANGTVTIANVGRGADYQE